MVHGNHTHIRPPVHIYIFPSLSTLHVRSLKSVLRERKCACTIFVLFGPAKRTQFCTKRRRLQLCSSARTRWDEVKRLRRRCEWYDSGKSHSGITSTICRMQPDDADDCCCCRNAYVLDSLRRVSHARIQGIGGTTTDTHTHSLAGCRDWRWGAGGVLQGVYIFYVRFV